MNMPIPENRAAESAGPPENRDLGAVAPGAGAGLRQARPAPAQRSPVMLVVELTAMLTTVLCFIPDTA
jgi:K+-transporting ATPase ATPase B chain